MTDHVDLPDELDASAVAALGEFSTPSVLNGLKRLGMPTGEFESSSRSALRCMAPELGARVGIAVTRTVATRRGGPPGSPDRAREQADAFEELLAAVPGPRMLVVENVGDWAGPVCIWGEVAANINLATGFVAGMTNGPVRDIREMRESGFVAFAGGVDVGGGNVEVLSTGAPVTVAGMSVRTGDLLHGDEHGVVKVPWRYAAALPDAIRAHEAIERRVIAVCRSADFSAAALAAAWTSGSVGPTH